MRTGSGPSRGGGDEPARRPTIVDIARRARLSKSAVSYALNGQPGVSDRTRRRVLTIAAEMGWRPNSAARALSRARALAVGLVVARPAETLGVEPFFMQLIAGVESELSRSGVALLLQVVGDAAAEVEVYERWSGERLVDGVIVVDLEVHDVRIPVLERLRLPAVVLGGPGHHGALPGVWSDDAAATTAAVEYLVALGHRRLARVAGLPRFLHTRIRTDAFLAAAAAAGLISPACVDTDYSGEDGGRATRTLLSSPAPPSAILYDNDVMAVAAVAVAREMGVVIPRDLSIIAWDDSPLCQLVHPPLTALRRDIFGYGARVAHQLLDHLDGRPVTDFQDATPRLVPRGSTASPVHMRA